jgi:hypothetical protein
MLMPVMVLVLVLAVFVIEIGWLGVRLRDVSANSTNCRV